VQRFFCILLPFFAGPPPGPLGFVYCLLSSLSFLRFGEFFRVNAAFPNCHSCTPSLRAVVSLLVSLAVSLNHFFFSERSVSPLTQEPRNHHSFNPSTNATESPQFPNPVIRLACLTLLIVFFLPDPRRMHIYLWGYPSDPSFLFFISCFCFVLRFLFGFSCSGFKCVSVRMSTIP